MTTRYLPLLSLWIALCGGHAQAGDRQLEIRLVNMTPDALSKKESARQCMREIEKRLGADYTALTKMGETPLRKLFGKTSGESFLGFSAEDAAKVKAKLDKSTDALVLIDCRPEENLITAAVYPPAGGVARIKLAGKDALAAIVVAEAILRRAWQGFSP